MRLEGRASTGHYGQTERGWMDDRVVLRCSVEGPAVNSNQLHSELLCRKTGKQVGRLVVDERVEELSFGERRVWMMLKLHPFNKLQSGLVWGRTDRRSVAYGTVAQYGGIKDWSRLGGSGLAKLYGSQGQEQDRTGGLVRSGVLLFRSGRSKF